MSDLKNEYSDTVLAFCMNMRLIADILERSRLHLELYFGGAENKIQGARMYIGQKELDNRYVYILNTDQISESFPGVKNQAFVIIGRTPVEKIPAESNVIVTDNRIEVITLLESLQDEIEKYRLWDWKLQMALASDTPLDDILMASMEVLRNPMFIHDSNFFILSDPKHSPFTTQWERDKRTNKEMVPVNLINDFRTDTEYLKGLKSKKPVLYPADQTGYRILYRNLWNGERYEGRILVDEVQNTIQPGDYYVIDYLGKVLELFIRRRHLVWLSIGNDVEKFLQDCMQKNEMDDRQAVSYLQYLHWNRFDRYICLRIESEQIAFNLISSSALLGRIETQIQSGKAFYMDNGIVVVVNLSYHHVTAAETVSRLAVLMREGLLKIGISSEVRDFMLIPKAYRQARIALDFGRISNSMYWYFYFDDYMLEYMVDCASKEIPLDMLCADALEKLRRYDAENNAELYHTLEVYLRLEKNVLRTAKELFIHRSTLSYRLDRIQKVINVNLDDPKERLKLEISYFMESGSRS